MIVKIFLVCSKQKNYEFLKKFYNFDNIAYVNKKNISKTDIKNEIKEDIKLNEILYADRAIKINNYNQLYLKKLEIFTHKF